MTVPKRSLPDEPALHALWALPYPLMVLDEEMRVCGQNDAARGLLTEAGRKELGQKCGEVLSCLHALRADDCCGTTEHCPECDVRNGVAQAQRERTTVQACVSVQRGPEPDQLVHMLVTAVGYEGAEGRRAVVMLQDIPELAVSAGLIPVCAACHKMRDEAGEWHDLGAF
ncbi:MAG: hypothetical protein KKI08_09025, partial [Armatimonadetes bacterium]|nr:hypothetical protein [Armatimonadota bacterium]